MPGNPEEIEIWCYLDQGQAKLPDLDEDQELTQDLDQITDLDLQQDLPIKCWGAILKVKVDVN
jgi:hypothetical protein